MTLLRTTIPLVIAGAIGAVGALGLQSRWAGAAQKPKARVVAKEDPRDAELSDLRARLGALEARSAIGARATVQPVPINGNRAGQAEEPRDPDTLQKERALADWMKDHYTPEVQAKVFGHYFADLDVVRGAERRDAGWEREMTSGLQKMLDDGTHELGKVTVQRFDCGATLCRLQLDVENVQVRGKLVQTIQHTLHFDEASAFMPAGEKQVDAYLARQGATLPDFDQLKYVGAEMSANAG